MSDMVTTSGQQKGYEQHTNSMQRMTNEQQESYATKALQIQNDGIDKSVGIEHVDHTSQCSAYITTAVRNQRANRATERANQ